MNMLVGGMSVNLYNKLLDINAIITMTNHTSMHIVISLTAALLAKLLASSLLCTIYNFNVLRITRKSK